MSNNYLLATCIACAMNLPQPGEAQEVAGANPPGTAAEGSSVETLVEIVVTAQRRDESAQDVPVSVVAFDGESLERLAVGSLDSLAVVTPGLTFGRVGPGAGTPFLRGVGSNITSPGSEAAVSTYIDNVYIGSQYASVFSFNNVASIEVDKGPQGTLFGRNATGGVIQIKTKDPAHAPSADIRLGYGSYDTSTGNLYATTGITDTLAADIALYANDQREGWGKNLFTGQDIYTSKNYAARSKWLWTPNDATAVTFIADYAYDRQDVGTAYSRAPGVSFRPPGPGGNPGPYLSEYQGFYNVDLNRPSFSRSNQHGFSLKAYHDFGAVQGVSISSYRRAVVYGPIDSDASPADWKALDTNPASETYTQEVQLLSPDDPSARLSWILGAFYYRDHATDFPISLVGYGYSPLAPVDINSYQDTDSYSAFAQTTYEMIADTRITVGLRQTWDERETRGTQVLRINPPLLLTQTTLPGTATPGAREVKYSEPTWKVAIDHDFGADMMAYVSYSRGFKAGVFNMVSLNTQPVGPEKIDAYEVGFKSELVDGRMRLNLAAYRYDYRNLQVQQFVNGFYILANAAAARIDGIDLELAMMPLPNLTLGISGTLLDPQYTSFPGGPGYVAVPIGSVNPAGGMGGYQLVPADLAGKQLIYTSEKTFNLNADYRLNTGIGSFDLVGAAQYRSDYYFDPQNGARQPGYVQLNGSIAWTSPKEVYDVRLWGNNLTDRRIYATIARSSNGDNATPQAPRTYGISVGVHF